MREIPFWTLAECGVGLVLMGMAVQSIRRRIGLDTHGSFGQWIAALLVGLALALWVIIAAPEQFLVAADLTAGPGSGQPIRFLIGLLVGLGFLVLVAMMLLFDRELGRYWLYRFFRVIGRGCIIMFVLLTAVRVFLGMG